MVCNAFRKKGGFLCRNFESDERIYMEGPPRLWKFLFRKKKMQSYYNWKPFMDWSKQLSNFGENCSRHSNEWSTEEAKLILASTLGGQH
jgi:hypothetical protein